MDYRQLGKAGIRVSELSLGPWLTFSKHLSVKHAKKIVNIAIDKGINFFDNAERYAEGMAECLMGEVFRSYQRESLVITTKLYWGGDGVNDIGLSRKHLLEGIKNSLRRLQLDYVDIVFCHRPDPLTPIEETILAMDKIIRDGHAIYWGTSEWSSGQIEMAYKLAQDMHCISPSTEQSEYNLFNRYRVEEEYKKLYQKYGMGLTTWGPLASGILTGKYSKGFPEKSRLQSEKRFIGNDFQSRIDKANRLVLLAQKLGWTPAQLSIAWILSKQFVSTVIIGASNEDQLLENISAVGLKNKISPEIDNELNTIFEVNDAK
ncbi:MAG: aldo/keto reductase [Candidatus Aquirickettsiella gammari]|jgi:voltage-dependent potassium channel beta subunit|uniref:Aldo/keto reductase n=1 Tax=Candidatus Aquirickettsiella gammari TaxID=2016198 RepID=A0A370CHY4_9COXI|nr:MAG: aldo/keto reductase [Candidatus Aquirickettsiella gammari]